MFVWYMTLRLHASECHAESAYKGNTSSLSQMTNSGVLRLFAACPLFLSRVPLHYFDVSDIHIRGGLLYLNTSRQTVSLFYVAHLATVFQILITNIVLPVHTFSIDAILFDI
ncbi:hypothetical protein [Saccharococcus thermophilus]|uniref:hypothetical protein n=1 Tax=Saccharococcus thermophilus TaxID=29396 RepID=UPI0036D2BB6F